MIRRTLLVLGLVAFLSSPLEARDLYVNNLTGDDHLDGGAPELVNDRIGPMRSISRALKAARAGDRIVVANTGRAYRECLTLQGQQHSTNGVRNFSIVGNGAILDGRVEVAEQAWRHERGEIFSFQPHLQGQQMLYLQDRPLNQLRVKQAAEIENLEELQWAWFQGRIYFRGEKDRLPVDYELSYCGHSVGITLYAVRGVEISDLIVQGFQLDGINAHDAVSEATIVGSTLRGNARSGVHVGGASRVKVEACLIGDNNQAQVHCTDYCRVEILNCDIIDSDPAAPKLLAERTAQVAERTAQ